MEITLQVYICVVMAYLKELFVTQTLFVLEDGRGSAVAIATGYEQDD
jgi:hypothetical protein